MSNDLLHRSFKYCEQVAKDHYENFPVASRLIPRKKRKHIYAVYAFARTADDFADEPGKGTAEERLALIRGWQSNLLRCYSGYNFDESQPVFIALQQTIRECSLPAEPMLDLLKAFSQDVVKNRYNTFAELLTYCKNSANPIGRLMLIVLGKRAGQQEFECSDYICTALQLTNFWQDVETDLGKNRVYIPIEDMRRFKYTEDMLFRRVFNDKFRNLMQFEIERTEELFRKGEPLLESVGSAKELNLILLGGKEILNKIRSNDYNVFYRRPVLGKLDIAKMLLKVSIA